MIKKNKSFLLLMLFLLFQVKPANAEFPWKIFNPRSFVVGTFNVIRNSPRFLWNTITFAQWRKNSSTQPSLLFQVVTPDSKIDTERPFSSPVDTSLMPGFNGGSSGKFWDTFGLNIKTKKTAKEENNKNIEEDKKQLTALEFFLVDSLADLAGFTDEQINDLKSLTTGLQHRLISLGKQHQNSSDETIKARKETIENTLRHLQDITNTFEKKIKDETLPNLTAELSKKIDDTAKETTNQVLQTTRRLKRIETALHNRIGRETAAYLHFSKQQLNEALDNTKKRKKEVEQYRKNTDHINSDIKSLNNDLRILANEVQDASNTGKSYQKIKYLNQNPCEIQIVVQTPRSTPTFSKKPGLGEIAPQTAAFLNKKYKQLCNQ